MKLKKLFYMLKIDILVKWILPEICLLILFIIFFEDLVEFFNK